MAGKREVGRANSTVMFRDLQSQKNEIRLWGRIAAKADVNAVGRGQRHAHVLFAKDTDDAGGGFMVDNGFVVFADDINTNFPGQIGQWIG